MFAFGIKHLRRSPERLTISILFLLSFIAVATTGIPIRTIPGLLLDSSNLLFFTLGTILILSIGEIDLSVFGLASLSAIATLWITGFIPSDMRALSVIVVAILISSLLSTANGWLIVHFGRSSLLITIATFSTFYGSSMILFLRTTGTNAPSNRYTIPAAIEGLPSKQLLGIRAEAIIILVTLLALLVLLDRTKLGLQMKAIGQSFTSARYVGMNVDRIRVLTFALSGVLYGLGTILTFARFSTTRPSELARDAVVPIMCAVLSGASIQGGRLPIVFPILGVGTFLCLQQTVFAMRIFPAESYHAVFGGVLLLYILLRSRS